MDNTLEVLEERYAELCQQRDEVNSSISGIKEALAAARARSLEAQAEMEALAAQLNEARGGAQWLGLKKDIGKLATAIQVLKKRS